MTTLGSGFRRPTPDYGPLADMVSGLRDSIVEEVSGALIPVVCQAIAAIDLHPSQVNVAAPNVTVTPTINVEAEDETGEIDAINAQTDMLRQVNDKLGAIQAFLARPVIREVERDNTGQITRITETR